MNSIGDQISSDPAAFLCGIVSQADTSGAACDLIQQSFPRTTLFGQHGGTSSSVDQFDPTLGGFVEVSR